MERITPNTGKSPREGVARAARHIFLVSAVATLLVYWSPMGRLVEQPFRYLATMVHEMGHGVAALLVGGSFSELVIRTGGGGYAVVGGYPADSWQDAIVCGAGLIGPSVVAAIGFFVARRAQMSRIFLGTIGGCLVLAGVLVARIPLVIATIGITAGACLFVAIRTEKEVASCVTVFLSMQLALSLFSDSGYALSKFASGDKLSDSARMAVGLGGSYWMWGALCVLISLIVLAAGAWWLLRKDRRHRYSEYKGSRSLPPP